MFLFAYGTLQQEGSDPSSYFSRYQLGRVMRTVGHAVLSDAKLVHVETMNSWGESITHPGVLVGEKGLEVHGTLFEIKMPERSSIQDNLLLGTPEAEAEKIIEKANSLDDIVPLFDFIEGVKHPLDPYNPENYFYRTSCEVHVNGNKQVAFAYFLNPHTKRFPEGRSKIVGAVESGDWLSYIKR